MKETWKEKERKRGLLEKLSQIFNNGMNVSYKVLGWYIKPYPIQNYQKLQIQTLLQGESWEKNKKQRKKSKSQKQLEQCSRNSGRLAGKHPFLQRMKFRKVAKFCNVAKFRKVAKFTMFAKLATKLRNFHSSSILHCTSSTHPIFALMLSFQLEFFMNELDS